MTDQVLSIARAEDVRRLCGDVADWKLAAILELKPTLGQLATAAARAGGQDEFTDDPHQLSGLAAQLYDVLTSDEAYEDER
jgi:hypothetical protein